jgi:hypothetical protein
MPARFVPGAQTCPDCNHPLGTSHSEVLCKEAVRERAIRLVIENRLLREVVRELKRRLRARTPDPDKAAAPRNGHDRNDCMEEQKCWY